MTPSEHAEPCGGCLVNLVVDEERRSPLKGFTGVDAPYETPASPEAGIDTANPTPDQSAREILLLPGQKGYI